MHNLHAGGTTRKEYRNKSNRIRIRHILFYEQAVCRRGLKWKRAYLIKVVIVAFEGQGLRARLCCRKISDSIFWLHCFTPR